MEDFKYLTFLTGPESLSLGVLPCNKMDMHLAMPLQAPSESRGVSCALASATSNINPLQRVVKSYRSASVYGPNSPDVVGVSGSSLFAADLLLLVVVVVAEVAAMDDDDGFAFAFFLLDLGGFLLGMMKDEETTRFWRIKNIFSLQCFFYL